MPAFFMLAAAVVALPLPTGFTIAPEGERRLMSINARGTVVATMDRPSATPATWSMTSRAVRWTRAGVRRVFRPLPPDPSAPSSLTQYETVNALGPDDVAYVEVARPFSGAYSGTARETQRWTAAGAARYHPPACRGERGDLDVAAVDERGRIALSLDPASLMISPDQDRAQFAPFGALVDGTSCAPLGRGAVRAIRGRFAAGFRAYLDGKLVPVNMNPARQALRAVRWSAGALRELGEGIALGVNAHGLVVGASTIPAQDSGFTVRGRGPHGPFGNDGIPQARVWDVAGRARDIAPDSGRSVAYDVANDGTVVGMIQERDSKHYAFVWRAGALNRLDDLPHPPGWRFESAYTIAPDGAIVGIGTYRGVATAFIWLRSP